MAQRSSSGRGTTATKSRPGNQGPNTPGVRESEIARLRVDEIRDQLKQRGISGVSNQRKDELVKTLVKAMRAEQRRGPSAKKTVSAAAKAPSAAKRGPARKTTVAAKPAARTAGTTKRGATTAKSTSSTSRTKTAATATRKGASSGAAAATGTRKGASSGAAAPKASASSLKYAQQISSPDEQPSRPGRSLVTTNHDVIQRWAQARGAVPATIEGTEREGRPGVLRFDFPGFGGGGRLRQVSWNEWFDTFDKRRLNFIYQEQYTSGRQSNFFRLESPEREDA